MLICFLIIICLIHPRKTLLTKKNQAYAYIKIGKL